MSVAPDTVRQCPRVKPVCPQFRGRAVTQKAEGLQKGEDVLAYHEWKWSSAKEPQIWVPEAKSTRRVPGPELADIGLAGVSVLKIAFPQRNCSKDSAPICDKIRREQTSFPKELSKFETICTLRK
jgi:hypothetical protein